MFTEKTISSKDITLNDLKSFYSSIDFEFNYSTFMNLYNLITLEISYIISSEKESMYFDEMGMLYTSDELLFKAIQLGEE